MCVLSVVLRFDHFEVLHHVASARLSKTNFFFITLNRSFRFSFLMGHCFNMTDAVAEIVIDVVSVRDVVVLFRGVTINSRRDSHRERESVVPWVSRVGGEICRKMRLENAARRRSHSTPHRRLRFAPPGNSGTGSTRAGATTAFSLSSLSFSSIKSDVKKRALKTLNSCPPSVPTPGNLHHHGLNKSTSQWVTYRLKLKTRFLSFTLQFQEIY